MRLIPEFSLLLSVQCSSQTILDVMKARLQKFIRKNDFEFLEKRFFVFRLDKNDISYIQKMNLFWYEQDRLDLTSISDVDRWQGPSTA